MIIDAHTHIFPDNVAPKAISSVVENTGGKLGFHTGGTAGSLIDSMDAAGIDYSVVLPVATRPGQGQGILQWVKKMAPLHPKLIFFGSVHPYDPRCRETIKAVKDADVKGIKFHPGYQDYPADSIEALRVYEEALGRGLILHFHSGDDPSLPGCDYTSVERFSKLLGSFPGADIILAHAGGMFRWQKAIDLLGNRGAYFDIAFVLEKMLSSDTAMELYRQNEDYFIFGTDSPWRSQEEYVRMISASDLFTPVQKEKLFSGNLLRLIDLPETSV